MTKSIPALEGASDRRTAVDFGLTDRALRFAQLRAAHPWSTVSYCANAAGYSDRSRGAHVRGCELLRDPRVIRAIVHFGSLKLAEAMATATARLGQLPQRDRFFAWVDQRTVENIATDVAELVRRIDRLDEVMTARG